MKTRENNNEIVVSVLMSVYNAENFIHDSIQSILNQTFQNYEFIIIDDGSRDSTVEVIRSYMNEDRRIILLENGKNIGLAGSLNKGLKIAKGRYIARMDDDDISYINRFELQHAFLERNPDTFLVSGGADLIDEDQRLLKVMTPIMNSKKLLKRFLIKNPLIHPSIMFRNEGDLFYREKLLHVEDYDFYLRLLSSGKVISNIRATLVKCRVRKNSVSDSNRAYQRLFAEKVKEFYFQRMKNGIDEYDTFEPDEILKINTSESKIKIVLEANIRSKLILGDIKNTRRYVEMYFQEYGYMNRFFFVYLSTLIPRGIYKALIKHIPTALLRYFNN